MKKTKTLGFEPRGSSTPSFYFNGDVIEQVEKFRYLGVVAEYQGAEPSL